MATPGPGLQGGHPNGGVHKPRLVNTNKNETAVNQNNFKFSDIKKNCDMCEVVFLSQPLLNEHITQFHTENRTEEVQDTNETSRDNIQLHCALEESPNCEFQCSSRNQLKKHIESVHRIKTLLQCTMCTLTFKNVEDLSDHMNMVHKTVENTLLKCTQCRKSLKDKGELNKHMIESHKT